ncbi:helix-turn-helix transcriptional regulator [Chitinophaga sp. RAB17]|uniref:helix-turn-helix transcriptional regulator n=1 Tax=Chitinophaga sp. RAB17 TaxID=3233049 RepID=UPI003F8F804C
MPLLFNNPQQPTAFYRNAISGTDLNSTDLVESIDNIGMEHADMTFQNWCFEGFRLAYAVLGQQQATTYGIKNDIDAVKIYFNRKGRTRINYRQLSKSFSIERGQYNMLYAAELDSSMSHIDDHSEIFSLQITQNCFQDLIAEGRITMDQFAGKAANSQPALFSNQWLSMNDAMEKCIDDILHCRFHSSMKKIYLRSKAVELFLLFADASAGISPEKNTMVKSAADKEKLYFIKDYLTRHYADPVQFSGLARLASLNEFKLKTGFKALFNTSVIDFLIHYRLERARELLRSSTKNVSEVAYETGYASPAYFSKAFKKKYGVSPKQL